MTEGVALNAGAGAHVRVDDGQLALTNLRAGSGLVPRSECPGVGLLLLIASGLVNAEIALVLCAGTVDVGVVDNRNRRLCQRRGTAQQGQDKQRLPHLICLRSGSAVGQDRAERSS